jgi:UDP-glucose 4-epimerase
VSRVLVTGGAGYVGSVCCQQLLDRGHEVLVLDNLSTGHAEAVPAGARLYEIDYGDRTSVGTMLKRSRIDAVFHFAAKALIPESILNPGAFFDANVASGISFLETLRTAGVKRVIFSSSAAVYGNPQRVPLDEDHPKNPVNSYGESKLIFERVLQWYAMAYQWNIVAFRYFNASGATHRNGEMHFPETHIIPLLLETAVGEREQFEIFGDDYDTSDGTCIRDYVHVCDIARAHLLALSTLNTPGMKAYNIGCGQGHSVRQVIRTVEEVTGKEIPVRVSARRPGDPAVLCASPARLIRELGWKPTCPDLREIVRTAWKWKQQNAVVFAA